MHLVALVHSMPFFFFFCLVARGAASSLHARSLSPVVISPSQYFEGNDGPWSSFFLRVGTPEQYIRVLVSTASPESMVVLSEYGCSDSAFPNAPSDCAFSRGNLFNSSQSSSWNRLGLYNINNNGVGLEANLGYSQRSEFATDNLGLSLNGPKLQNQTLAGIATPDPFYLGIFGLNPQQVNLTTLGNSSSPSFFETLRNQKMIPSLSWSYTAGAKYRLKQVYGQLILSGYDESRLISNSVSFTMADDITRDLVVYLQSISYSGSTSSILLSEPIDIFIDSTDPNLWLPDNVCDEFEKAFELTVDDETGLYLINDTHNTNLLNSNAEVTFRLSDVGSGGDAVAITLPYEAFGLTVKPPLVKNTSYYFPLRRAANSTQYTLGRVFLQEAYLSVDYERGIFNVSACSWKEETEENVLQITSKNEDSSSCSGDGCSSVQNSSRSSASLSRGAVAGISVGAVVGVILLSGIIIFYIRRHRQKRKNKAIDPKPNISVISGPIHNHGPPESPSHEHDSLGQSAFWSPATINSSSYLNTNQTNGSSGDSGNPGNGSGENELDGHDTQIKPVYHELAGSKVPV